MAKQTDVASAEHAEHEMPSGREVFLYFLMLGFVNVGGPVAQIQAFLAGASAAVVGIIIVVSLDLAPEALVGLPSIVITVTAFLLITLLRVDVALIALGAITTGVLYAAAKTMF